MMQLNGLTDVRDLEIGSIFLVPPKAGTYTPTPDTRPPTETPVPTDLPPTITPFVLPTATVEITPTLAIATADANVAPPGLEVALSVSPSPAPSSEPDQAVQVAAVATQSEVRPVTATIQPRGSNTWIMIAVGVQMVVLIGAGIEFLRRTLRKRR
jgi:hypothetical protein